MTTLERDITETTARERGMTEENTALIEAPGPVNTNEYKMLVHQATAAIKSGLLPRAIDTPQKALTIILRGRELGLSGMYALANIAVIDGKATCSAELMLALIYHRHGDGAIRFAETNRERCVIRYKRRDWSQPDEYGFDMEDAKLAGLTGKDNWRKYPAAMLRARCISAVARMAFPDCIGGLYTPEELGAEVGMDAEGAFEIREESSQSEPGPQRSSGDWQTLYDTEEVHRQYEEVRPNVFMRAAPDEEPEAAEPMEPMASENQLATVAKLARLTDTDVDFEVAMTQRDARNLIAELQRRYMEQKTDQQEA